jgi:hypothetical protein
MPFSFGNDGNGLKVNNQKIRNNFIYKMYKWTVTFVEWLQLVYRMISNGILVTVYAYQQHPLPMAELYPVLLSILKNRLPIKWHLKIL